MNWGADLPFANSMIDTWAVVDVRDENMRVSDLSLNAQQQK
jgi:hypothetical protein